MKWGGVVRTQDGEEPPGDLVAEVLVVAPEMDLQVLRSGISQTVSERILGAEVLFRLLDLLLQSGEPGFGRIGEEFFGLVLGNRKTGRSGRSTDP